MEAENIAVVDGVTCKCNCR